MGFFRKATIGLVCFVLFVSLNSFGAALATRQVIGQPGPVEQALAKANAYNAIVPGFIQGNHGSTALGLPLSLPVVQTALQEAFPQSVIQPAANQIISATYAWVQGKASTISFRINLSGARTNLANYVEQAAEQQAAQLPACSYSQLLSLPQTALQNPLAVDCLPPGVTSTELGILAKQSILDSDFLRDPVLTPSALEISDGYQIKLPNNPSESSGSTSLPKAYRWLTESLYASLILTILCVSAIILLHRDRRRGLGRAGVTVTLASLASLFDAFCTGEIPNWLKSSRLETSSTQLSGGLQQVITKTVSMLAEDIHHWLLWYGSILFIIGLCAWIVARILQNRAKQQRQHVPEATSTAGNNSVQIT